MAKQLAIETAVTEIEKLKNARDFCSDWPTKWRPIAVAAQGILQVFYPPGAKVLEWMIKIVDSFCAGV